MNVLQRFERRLERLVNGTFAKAFKSDLEPVELAAGLQRELDVRARILSRDRALVPNVFSVSLSAYDHANLSPYSGTLSQELADVVVGHAKVQRYAFSGPVSIRFLEDDALGTGQFSITSEVVAGVERPASAERAQAEAGEAAAGAPAGFLEVAGTVHPVRAVGLLIGRGSDCDIRIDDAGISRRHAELRVHGEADQARVVIVDLKSTNGTTVDGARITQVTLHDGSRIVLGESVLTFHRRDPRR